MRVWNFLKVLLFGSIGYYIGTCFVKEITGSADAWIWYRISIISIVIMVGLFTRERNFKKKEIVVIPHVQSTIIEQRMNYKMCTECKTENSNTREKCYYCGNHF